MSTNSIGRKEGLFIFLTTLFCLVLVLSNLIASKLFKMPFTTNQALPAGALIYPLTFWILDLVTEIYGILHARFTIYLGFFICFVAYFVMQLALFLPPDESWPWQIAYENIFNVSGMALIASVCAYIIGQHADVVLYSWIRGHTGTQHLWLRSSASNLIAQMFDTAIYNVILFYWGLQLDLSVVITISLACYAYKALFAVLNLPFFYAAIFLIKRFLYSNKQPLSNAPSPTQNLQSIP